MYVRFLRRTMSVSVPNNVPSICISSIIFCFLLIVCYVIFGSFIVEFFCFSIGAIFFIALFKMFLFINPMSSHIVCQLHIQLCCFVK